MIRRSILLAGMVATAPPLQAQITAHRFMEVTAGAVVARPALSPDDPNQSRLAFALDAGGLLPVGSRTALGLVGGLGVQGDIGYFMLGPRLRFVATPRLAVDVTPAMMFLRDDNREGDLLLDVAVLYRQTVGLALRVAPGLERHDRTSFDAPPYTGTTFATGVRVGGKPGTKLGSVALGAALIVGLVLFFSGDIVAY